MTEQAGGRESKGREVESRESRATESREKEKRRERSGSRDRGWPRAVPGGLLQEAQHLGMGRGLRRRRRRRGEEERRSEEKCSGDTGHLDDV